MALLREYEIDIAGKDCVVVGRSNIVGKPMALLLLRENGTVTICHSKTAHLSEVTARADILVSAVGKTGFITGDMVKEGAVVVDVAMNRDAEGKLLRRLCVRRGGEKSLLHYAGARRRWSHDTLGADAEHPCSGKRPSAGLTEEEKVRLFPIFFCFYLDNSGPVVLC